MAADLRASFDRYYISMSVMEIHQSDWANGVDRLPYNTVLYLDLIAFEPGTTASKIAERLGLTKATVTATLNRLEDKGYIVRETSDTDARVRELRLSDDMAAAYTVGGRSMGWVADRMAELYSREDIERFCEMLDCASELMDRWRYDSAEEGAGDRDPKG